MITIDRNLKAVFSYEEKLLLNNKKLAVVKDELKVVPMKKTDSFIARLITQNIMSNLRIPVLSLNELSESNESPLLYLNSSVFKASNLSDYKSSLEEKIKKSSNIPLVSEFGLRKDRIEAFKSELECVKSLIKINDKSWKSTLERFLKEKEGVFVSVKSIEKDGYHHVRVVTKNLNNSYAVPLSHSEMFDTGYILGLISRDLQK